MKKVRYNKELIMGYGLTDGKVYDVIEYIKSKNGLFWDRLTIINDYGFVATHDVCDYYKNRRVFIDVTAEFRDNVIDGILT